MYIKLDNRIYPYTIIYSYTVNVNLILICSELSELIIIVNIPEICRYLKLYIISVCIILFCQSIPP